MKKLPFFKKKITAMVVAMTICGNVSATDIVNDPLHMAQTVAGWAAEAGYWGSQLTGMQQQFQQLQTTFNSLNGSRGMGDLVNNPASRQYLPANYQDILAGGYGNSNAIRQASKLFGIGETTLGADSASAKAFESNANQAAINRATMEDGYYRASQRFNDIQVLLNKVNASPEAKDIADLQARIQAEQVMLQNESNKLAMLGQLAEAQRDMSNQRHVEIGMMTTKGNMPNGW